jgi:hypothetical protein
MGSLGLAVTYYPLKPHNYIYPGVSSSSWLLCLPVIGSLYSKLSGAESVDGCSLIFSGVGNLVVRLQEDPEERNHPGATYVLMMTTGRRAAPTQRYVQLLVTMGLIPLTVDERVKGTRQRQERGEQCLTRVLDKVHAL